LGLWVVGEGIAEVIVSVWVYAESGVVCCGGEVDRGACVVESYTSVGVLVRT
jgi:hypothetical protein